MGGRAWTSDEVAAALGVPAPKKLKFKAVFTDTRTPSPESRENYQRTVAPTPTMRGCMMLFGARYCCDRMLCDW